MWSVTLAPPASLSDSGKLEALRRFDQFREWRSLDDKRFCLVCGKIITGHQIHVDGGMHGNGALRLSCPTEKCDSIPMDWVLPTDEILALTEIVVPKGFDVTPTGVPDRERHWLTSQLRRLATRLKQGF